jgi:hypothetical protein
MNDANQQTPIAQNIYHVSLGAWFNVRLLNTSNCGEVNSGEAQTQTNSATEEAVQKRIDGVCQDLVYNLTSKPQRRQLERAIDQAERVAPVSNEALGRAIGRTPGGLLP